MLQKNRVIIVVLDSFGIGALPDAAKFGDAGSDTLGHIDAYCKAHNIDFSIPNLLQLGLGRAYTAVNAKILNCDKNNYPLIGSYGACCEASSGKDTTSGHWEIALCPVLFDWGYFSNHTQSFPEALLDKIVARTNIPGYLGNCHASGTDIIRDWGDEHVKSGKPIFYTSADSVFQIACHEESFGIDQLYALCQIVREELAPYNVARVIARPFSGTNASNYARTANRKDYSLSPATKTLFDLCTENNVLTVAVGKIGDIYAHQGTQIEIKASGLADLCDATIKAIDDHTDKAALIMTNLVDFDMLYGHRRDVVGYKTALEYFDSRIPDLLASLSCNDMLILTADHGCDPTWTGTDHTREHIPFIMYHNGETTQLGISKTFAEIGITAAKHLSLPGY